MADDKITKKLEDPKHGVWEDRAGQSWFVPNPSFFTDVDPNDLVDYFQGSKHRLELP